MAKRVVTAPTRPADYHRTALSPSEWQARQKALGGDPQPASVKVEAKAK